MVGKKTVRAAGAAAAVALCATAANGAVFFTFQDPAGQRETTLTFGSVGGADGSISYLTSVPVNLEVDATEEGHGVTTIPAALTIDLTITPTLINPAPLTVLGSIAGSFEFRTLGTDELILAADVEPSAGAIFQSNTSGAFFGASAAMPGDPDMTFTRGPGLTPALDDLDLLAPFDFAFTLTNVTGTGETDATGQALYRANTAFTATALIPTPGSAALAGLGAVMLGRRRKARASA